MANQSLTVHLDAREFTQTLREYAKISSRTPANICNKKAYFVARRAIWYTPKADFQSVANELGQVLTTTKKGKLRSKWGSFVNSAISAAAPALALIINARRGKAGKPGLQGAQMMEAFRKVFGARARSIGFIKSGWIAARTMFSRYGASGSRNLPPNEGTGIGGVKQVGEAKGGGKAATAGLWNVHAQLWNTASTTRDHKGALVMYGLPALEKAVEEENADTRRFIEDELKKAAHSAGVRMGP